MLECYTTLAALARETVGPAERAGDRQHLPQPGAPGQDPHHARHRVGRPGPARHRRRLVRARAQLARLRVRHVHRPLREARGGAADHRADAARRASDPRRRALLGVRGDQPAAAGRAHPDHDRRLRREEDAPDGRAVRGRVEHHLGPSTRSPGSSTSLAAHCERLGRDRSEITVSQALNVCIAATHDEAYADMRTFLADRGLDIETMDEATRDQILALVVWGDPDEVGERLADVLSRGRGRHHLLAAGQRPRPRPRRAARPRWVPPPSKARSRSIRSSSVPR